MKGSLERVRKLLAGEKTDRMPHFDLLPNDEILAYFNGGVPVDFGDDESGMRAVGQATDATRWCYFSPTRDRVEVLPDGRKKKFERWTVWDDSRVPISLEEYARENRRKLEEARGNRGLTAENAEYRKETARKKVFDGDFYYIGLGECPKLMDAWLAFGLEEFCGYIAECEEGVLDLLEANTLNACAWADGLPEDDPFEMFFIGEDIAFNNGPMFNPAWLERNYFPRLKRVIDRFHARGKRILFHSDGNLDLIMNGLVGAGIDCLNPIDINAGMDIAKLHRLYPKLVFMGGIDVANLLPFGKPQEIRDAVNRAIDDAGGRILVGSSTEVGNSVPLENYLAMRSAVLSYKI